MVCLSLPLSMVLVLVWRCRGEVFRFALLATLSSLFPRFLARELLTSLALVFMRGACADGILLRCDGSEVAVELRTVFSVDLLKEGLGERGS